jgi:hypothetical protein
MRGVGNTCSALLVYSVRAHVTSVIGSMIADTNCVKQDHFFNYHSRGTRKKSGNSHPGAERFISCWNAGDKLVVDIDAAAATIGPLDNMRLDASCVHPAREPETLTASLEYNIITKFARTYRWETGADSA